EIGGDFFDVFRVGPDEWGIVIGDVSGKGAEAAAVTALARYSLRSLASDRIFPSDVLRDLNATLLRDGTDERFCTVVYATARPVATGLRLSVSIGGHHQPLVRRATGVVEQVGRLGTALGLIEDPDLYDATVDLDPGDVLCLFTDGLVEARHDRDLFGTENAAEVLAEHAGRSPEEIVAALAASARRFHGSQLTDDLAVLVVRVGD
ncbi:MAG: SpoIIE family protein phosphatase, partial [Propionibacteriales bacterium]|nr:SpoIIE family protein phosphatase [Propionibacteriales bacterium]